MKFHGRDRCFLLMLLLFFITLHAASAEYHKCDLSFNYTKGSKFESNLNTVLKSLIEHTSETGFNTSVDGQIYGLLQCRGDQTAEECYSCSQTASTTIRQNQTCGNAVGGRIWMDDCFLRYANYSFIGQLDRHGWFRYLLKNASNPDDFNARLKNLLANLSAEAAYGSGSKQYASGTTGDSSFPKIYALVQCTRDISTDDCTTCLSRASDYLYKQFSGSVGAQALFDSCIIRYEIYTFFKSTILPPQPAEAPGPIAIGLSNNSAEMKQSHISSKKIPIILGVAGGLLVVLLVCVFALGRRLKSAVFRRRREGHEEEDEHTLINEDRQIVFTMETLLAATENFHDANKLGQGGFGPVYKGTTQDGKEIAVKKLSLTSMQGKEEFLNEIKLLVKIQHRNLVNLLGCCTEGLERLLVYEYCPNNSLDKILFDPNKRNHLDWQKRYNIILGVARGLLYLHHDSQVRIIHRDIKSSNILLDEKLNPKISDFGLARLFPEDESHVNTRVAGTYGYMAPEYALQGQLTVKADVYSFGILLLEIVTGRKSTDYNLSPEKQVLLGWAWRSYETGNIEQMIDQAVMETCDVERALSCIHIGLLCTQGDSSLRPLMSTVTLMLSSHSVTLPDPTKPAFVSHVTQTTAPSSVSSASSQTPLESPPSNAEASITDLVPR